MIFTSTLVILGGNMGEMIEDNYYEKTINYQDEIDAAKRANAMETPPELVMQANGINFKFPYPVEGGEILLIRSENSEHDVQVPLKLNSRNEQLINAVRLIKGEYELRLRWKYNQEDYLIKTRVKWTDPSSSQP